MENLIYLDNGATSFPKPDEVYAFMDSFYRNFGTLLDGEYDIACRTGLHCAPLVHEQLGTAQIGGAVRIGIGPFNTEGHIRTAIEAIAEIVDFHRKNKSHQKSHKKEKFVK